MSYGVIYKITNMVNGKIYVGQTTNFKRRMKEYNIRKITSKHKKYAIMYDIVKYGWSAFTMEIIDSANSKDDLNNLEISWISKLKSTDPEIGYNKKTGGAGGTLNLESRIKMSESTKLFRHSEDTKLKKSIPIVFGRDSMILFCQSAKVLADTIGCERTHITRAAKHGYKVKGYYVAYFDKARRDEIRNRVKNKKYIDFLDMVDMGVETNDYTLIHVDV